MFTKKTIKTTIQKFFNLKKELPDQIEEKCQNCGGHISLSENYDAKYCLSCDVWKESACSDSDCNFCVNRPSKPSEIKDDVDVYGIMNTINLDFLDVNSVDDFFDVIQEKLAGSLGAKMGRNLNALRDTLQGGFGVGGYKEPLMIVIRNHENLKEITINKDSSENLWGLLLDTMKDLKHITLSINSSSN